MLHVPVLLNEVLTALDPQPGQFVIDGTLGGGGYTKAILEKLGGSGKFLGIDWDRRSLDSAEAQFENYAGRGIKIRLVNDNFASAAEILKRENLGLADGLVLDLGLSSDQLENSGRGFSFGKDEPLIMTYSDNSVPVKELIQKLDTDELAEIIKNLSQEKYAKQIAESIKFFGVVQPIETTGALVRAIIAAVPGNYERGRIHPATRTFMALRMYANKELENIQKVLENLPSILNPGGRAVIVAFHSGEDRLVKNSFRDMVKADKAEFINKKPISAAPEEIRANPRSRSAKLRAIKLRTI